MSKFTYKTTRRIRKFGYLVSRNFLDWIFSFPLLNIYKKGRRIRGFSSLLSNSFFKIFFYLLNIPKYIYKEGWRLRKFDSLLPHLFFNIFSFAKYLQVHLQKSQKAKKIWFPLTMFVFENLSLCKIFPSTSTKELKG
jgi:hypothetical protein